MPVSMLIHFFPQSKLSRSASGGRWLHGLIFSLFDRISCEYAKYIHQQYDYKSFTLSPLLTEKSGNEINEGQICQIRLTLLEDQKVTELLAILAEINQKELRLGNTTISIHKVQVSPEMNNIWVAYQTWEELVETPPFDYEVGEGLSGVVSASQSHVRVYTFSLLPTLLTKTISCQLLKMSILSGSVLSNYSHLIKQSWMNLLI